MKSSTNTLIDAMKILAAEIESGDGVANSAIFEASERLKEQAERIAELEQELNNMNHLLDNYDFVNSLNGKELEIRDLEQQAKGIALAMLKTTCNKNSKSYSESRLLRFAESLQEKAKQLKENQ